MTKTNCENCSLRQKACFYSLTPEQLKFVASMRRGQGELAAGRFLHQVGEIPKALYTLHEGWAAVGTEVPGQPPRITEILLPGDLLGATASVLGRYGRSVVALTRIRYCILDPSLPEKIAERGGPLCVAFFKFTVVQRTRREVIATLLRNGSPLQRLAYFFLETFMRLREIGLASDKMCSFPLRRSHLAQIVGLSEVHVSRTLGVMRKNGLIEITNNVLFIPSEERLGEAAGVRPPAYTLKRFMF